MDHPEDKEREFEEDHTRCGAFTREFLSAGSVGWFNLISVFYDGAAYEYGFDVCNSWRTQREAQEITKAKNQRDHAQRQFLRDVYLNTEHPN